MEAKPLTTADLDVEYAKVCSQIGQLYCESQELEAKLDALNDRLMELTRSRTDIMAQHRLALHNENMAAQSSAPLSIVP